MEIVIPIVAGIGNALMAGPMVRQLKKAGARVVVVARIGAMGEVFEGVADEVRVMGKGMGGMINAMQRVRREGCDLFLVPFPSNRWQYMALALASGARRRVLHGYPVGKFSALGFVPAERVEAVRGIHDVQQNLNLLRVFGIEPDYSEGPVFTLTGEDREWAKGAMEGVGLGGETRPVAIHCGSARTILAEAKRWPVEKYGEVVRRLRERGVAMMLIEGPDEEGTGEAINGAAGGCALPVIRLRGRLGYAGGVLERSALYLGSDSGLGHLAAAVGTATVTIFAPADPDRVCPWGYRDLVVQPRGKACSPCFMYPWEATRPKMRCCKPMCVNEVAVEDVMEKVEEGRMKAEG